MKLVLKYSFKGDSDDAYSYRKDYKLVRRSHEGQLNYSRAFVHSTDDKHFVTDNWNTLKYENI